MWLNEYQIYKLVKLIFIKKLKFLYHLHLKPTIILKYIQMNNKLNLIQKILKIWV